MAESAQSNPLTHRVLWAGIIGLSLLLGCINWGFLAAPRGYDVKQTKAQLGCKYVEQAIEKYIENEANTKHEFPATLHDLVKPPFGGQSFLRDGESALRDPWGKPYEMEIQQFNDGIKYILVKTTAPDGTPISQFGIGPNAQPRP